MESSYRGIKVCKVLKVILMKTQAKYRSNIYNKKLWQSLIDRIKKEVHKIIITHVTGQKILRWRKKIQRSAKIDT